MFESQQEFAKFDKFYGKISERDTKLNSSDEDQLKILNQELKTLVVDAMNVTQVDNENWPDEAPKLSKVSLWACIKEFKKRFIVTIGVTLAFVVSLFIIGFFLFV